jgi:alpha-D-ribose 1-methylphosphonate 5-triphosphate synthase subunit PhnG
MEMDEVRMDRTLRCELLARLSDAELSELAAIATGNSPAELIVVTEPTVGMIMARAIEGAHGETFNLGEVLVTECQIRIGEHEGWAMLMGSRKKGALAAATIDAALAADESKATAVDPILTRFIAHYDIALAAEQAELAATRVQFETQ